MQILSVTLKNFKIHRDRHFDFQPGVNAICGENGSGKTSILEAIAWTLFDYSSGYNKDELRWQDAKSAEVTVSMVSNLDGRTYSVQRETAKGRSDRYIIFDPQLNKQLDDINKIDETQRWLCEHLGMPKGSNLSKVFADVIGIPQGTFTLDFLKSATERRKVFDPILKVEEYKKAFKDSSDLERYAQGQAEHLVRSIEHLGDRLSDWDELKQAQTKQARAVEHTEAFLKTLEQQLKEMGTERDQLQKQAQQLAQLQQQVNQSQMQLRERQGVLATQTKLVEQAQQAQALCEANRDAHDAYQQAEKMLGQLNRQQRSRTQLQQQKSAQEAQLNPLQLQQAQLQTQLDQLDQAQKTLQDLQPKVQQQEKLETEREQLQLQLNQLQANQAKQRQLQTQQQSLEAQAKVLDEELERLRSLSAATEQLPQLEEQIHQLQTQLGQVSAAQQFQSVLSDLVDQAKKGTQKHQRQVTTAVKAISSKACEAIAALKPEADIQKALDKATKALESGVALHKDDLEALKSTLKEFQAQSDELQLREQLKAAQASLKAAQRQRLEYETLPAKTQQLEQLQTQLATLKTELEALANSLVDEDKTQQQLAQLSQSLTDLADPQGRCRLLAEQLAGAEQLRQRQANLIENQKNLKEAIATLTEKLVAFADLDDQLETQTAAKQTHQPGYQRYLQNQTTAQTLAQRQTQLQALTQEQDTLRSAIAQLETDLATATATHEPEKLAELERDFRDTKAQQDQLAGALPGQQRELERLAKELTQRSQWAEERDRLQQDLGNKQRVQQFVSDARRIYNQSGPRITQFYLNEIVREGDRLFRELMNRQNAALNWTEDYEIQVQEGSVWRGFKTLSGGEQMAAALAIRLALLKVLADLDIAFFDEPTTNMDKLRRQQLAEALANLKAFDQLFVISHDDTFETVTDSVIRVERQLV